MTPRRSRFGYLQSLMGPARRVGDWFDASVWLVGSDIHLPEEHKPARYWIVYGLLTVIVGAFIGRLHFLQIEKGSTNRVLAEGNRIRREIELAPRGAIVDARGRSLVTNEANFELAVVPSDFPLKKVQREPIVNRLAQEIDVDSQVIEDKLASAGLTSHLPLVLIPTLDRDKAIVYKVTLQDVPAVRVTYRPHRRYDSTAGLSHLLGYTGRMSDRDVARHPQYPPFAPIGKVGLEASYDEALRGTPGIKNVEVNATGQIQRTVDAQPPIIGQTLHLSLDLDLQTEMAAALQEAMGKEGAKQAVGVAIDPADGRILASVSVPSYDNSLFARGIRPDEYEAIVADENKPLLNRALDGVYPAGSTIKPFIAAAALEEKTITASTQLDTSAGVIVIGEQRFPDWKKHGVTNVTLAIAESNDIFFYALGGGYKHIPPLGIERIGRYLSHFGFGASTTTDYASDNPGLVPSPEWKRRAKKENWYIGDTYHVAIGQGNLLVTPMQMVRGLASLVNGGRLVTPHIVTAIEDPVTGRKNNLTFPTQPLRIQSSTLETVLSGMRLTVSGDSGSARSLKNLPFTSGGKTGTAQFGGRDNQKTHAWYIGYAPAESPKIAVAIIVEGGGEGNAIAVPVAGRVFQKYVGGL